MSGEKREFYGKEVTDAIRSACESLKVPQEMLDIEVLETGSTGIFGLIRKKAKIKVSIKEECEPPVVQEPTVPEPKATESVPAAVAAEDVDKGQPTDDGVETEEEAEAEGAEDDEDDEDEELPAECEVDDASEESQELVRSEVVRLIGLMGYSSTVEVSAKGLSVSCIIRGEAEEELTGPEGKTLDAIQYLIRKMVARKSSERLRISINIGDFRERRLEELKVRAVELAKMVKDSGKTQVLPALNPSERREIHMVLQEDKEVRSRSVGDGLFKKILIYKPGKSNRGGRRKSGPRNRRGRSGRGGGSGEE